MYAQVPMEDPGKEAVARHLNPAVPPLANDELKLYDEDVYTGSPSTHPLSCFLSTIMPCAWLCACYTVEEQEQAIVLQWGKLAGHATTPGIRCDNPCGRSIIKISTRQISKELHNLKVVDLRGNPLLVSGVVRYYFVNTIRTALEVENPYNYVEDQATAVLKQIVSRYPYESHDGGACLKTESEVIGRELVDTLQSRVMSSGARIMSLSLSNIAYAPEISSAMLKKQAAFALVEARQAIVQGAVDISIEACDELLALGHSVTPAFKAKIVSNLLTILCSDSNVAPVITMNSN